MSKDVVMGLDIGTTSVKAVVFHLNGRVISEAETPITSYYPKKGWVEQNPTEIERDTVKTIRKALELGNIHKDELLAVGLSSAMHSIICIDEKGEPLSQAIIWSDGRSDEQATRLMENGGSDIYSRTGIPIHPMSPLSKLLWMKEVQYEPFQKATYFMSIKEYLLYRWFKKRVIDYSMAAATGLFNGQLFKWDEELLNRVTVSENQLSTIVSPLEMLTEISENIANEMGVSKQVPFIIGAADGQLANLGIGAINKGDVAITAGTSGAIRQFTNTFKTTEHLETFCYPLTEETFIIGGPTNNGGIALQWLKNLLNYEGTFEQLLQEAESVPPGSDGIIFLPYINGERAPLWNQQAKANFFGMTITHKKEHFARAVLEGITYNLYQIGTSLEKLAGEPRAIYVNGGLARSKLWVQIVADLFGKDVYVSESHHSAAWGAAWTALLSIGKVKSFEEIKRNIPMGMPVRPIPENHERYATIYKRYQMLVKDIAKYF